MKKTRRRYDREFLNEYGTFEDDYENIWHFIEKVYNKKRLHSALDYMFQISSNWRLL